MKIDTEELAREVTEKIREEMAKIKIVDFAEVATATDIITGWTAKVILPGSNVQTTELNCLSHYTPTVGDWVMIVYPQGSSGVIIGKCPV